MLNSYFDKIFCINLNSRPDRWKEAEQEFNKHSIKVERIAAVEGAKMNLEFPPEIKEGAVGCSLSHFFCIKYAKQLGINKLLILEDDVEFVDNINELFSEYIKEVPPDWDMLYLGGQHYHGMNLQQVSEHVYKCEYTLTTHSVAFNSTVFDMFIDKLIDITKPCDTHYAESHKKINAYVIIPHLTWQRQSYSDVEKVNVDYTFLKSHRYPQWGKP